MHNSVRFFLRSCIYTCIFFVGVSCKDTDDFLSPGSKTEVKEANSFDFSTTQELDLVVDYSDFNAKIPVFFSVYNVNPFVNENTIEEYVDPNIKPIFAGYTEPNGKYDETVTLPAYAKVLHIDGHNPRAALAACKEARASGVIVNFDAGTLRDGVRELLSYGTSPFARASANEIDLICSG